MGLDSMRVGGGRCPPLFVGGLLLACFLLVCNWWSLSTENLQLLHQLDELGEQLKISNTERDRCVTMRENVEQIYKRLEGEVGSLHVRLQAQNELKKSNAEIAESLTMCKGELDSLNKLDATKSATLETLRLEKDRMAAQLSVKNEENERLKADLDDVQNDLDRLKFLITMPKENKAAAKTPLLVNSVYVNPAQLDPVDESAVKVSVSGQQGMLYHGIPILPEDPPGVKRQTPRLSVTMLKGPTSKTSARDGTHNNANAKETPEEQNEDLNNMSAGDEETKRFIIPKNGKSEATE